jgi:hypothetical protein
VIGGATGGTFEHYHVVRGDRHEGPFDTCPACTSGLSEPDPDIANDVAWWRAECDGMRKRITELETENADLRKRIPESAARTMPELTDLELVAARIRSPRRELQVAIGTIWPAGLILPDTTTRHRDVSGWLTVIQALHRHATSIQDGAGGTPTLHTLARWFPEARTIEAFRRLAAEAR